MFQRIFLSQCARVWGRGATDLRSATTIYVFISDWHFYEMRSCQCAAAGEGLHRFRKVRHSSEMCAALTVQAFLGGGEALALFIRWFDKYIQSFSFILLFDTYSSM